MTRWLGLSTNRRKLREMLSLGSLMKEVSLPDLGDSALHWFQPLGAKLIARKYWGSRALADLGHCGGKLGTESGN